MPKTTIIMDRSQNLEEQIKEHKEFLQSKGWHIQYTEMNYDGTVSFIGNTTCDCDFKFDICYCDGTCRS